MRLVIPARTLISPERCRQGSVEDPWVAEANLSARALGPAVGEAVSRGRRPVRAFGLIT